MGTTSRPPKWIKPQLTRLVDEAPAGGGWLHEIKYDGYRMHARIDGGDIRLLTRTGLDWSHRYKRTIEALGSLKVKSAYLNGGAMRPECRWRPGVQPAPGGNGAAQMTGWARRRARCRSDADGVIKQQMTSSGVKCPSANAPLLQGTSIFAERSQRWVARRSEDTCQ